MKDNYLWDGTGEVDPEIQQLKEVLGTLRYQPQPLRIPADVRISRRRTFFPALAIAAAIALLAVALGIWVSLGRRQASRTIEANTGSQGTSKPMDDPQRLTVAQDGPRRASSPTVKGGHPQNYQRKLIAVNRTRAPHPEIRQVELTPQELAEKEQVLLALRLVSVKLNLAQRKAQGAAPLNVTRYQHRIG